MYRLLYLFITVACLLILWSGYLLVKPYTLFKQNTPLTVTPLVVDAKTASLQLHSDTCVYYNKPSVIEVYIAQIGSATKILKNESTLHAGCRNSILPLPVSLIPEFVPNGQYYLRFEVTSDVNPLRTIKQSVNTTVFTLNR